MPQKTGKLVVPHTYSLRQDQIDWLENAGNRIASQLVRVAIDLYRSDLEAPAYHPAASVRAPRVIQRARKA